MIDLTDELKDRVRIHEGVRTQMYLDSLGKATNGIGHLIQPHERIDTEKVLKSPWKKSKNYLI